jgi:hypothetical protein
MKTYRLPALFCLPLMTVVLLAGCATKHPSVDTWRNPQFAPTPTNTFALTLRPNPTKEDAALGRMVVDELQRDGFSLVPVERADYLLTYVVSKTTEEHLWVDHTPPAAMLASAQTTGQIIMQSSLSGSVNEVRISHYLAKDIQLFLYTNPKTNPAGFQLIWQGTINLDNYASPERELTLLKTLLQYFGKDKNGPVDLVQ